MVWKFFRRRGGSEEQAGELPPGGADASAETSPAAEQLPESPPADLPPESPPALPADLPPESPPALPADLPPESPPALPADLPPESPPALPAALPAAERKTGWLSRLVKGLGRSSSKLTDGIAAIFTKRRLDDDAIEALEDLLIGADLGPAIAARLTGNLRKTRFGKDVEPQEIRAALAADIAEILAPVAVPLTIGAPRPFTVLVVGVNGSGKTTTIGKLAQALRGDGHKVMLAAGDTFRAAAIEQLKLWGERTGCPVVAREQGSDAAALAYDAVAQAQLVGSDVLLIDTAGRLHNKTDLMNELGKVVRVMRKHDPALPHACLLVLDATVGQNAVQQVETFRKMVPLSGLIVTKLDGTAKGGVLVALAERFKLPVHCIGVGESADDLRPFAAADFARALMDVGNDA